MKFSVIIPVYNVEQYLQECIDSIINQTYQDYEIILVNDGSEDNSGGICDRYATQNPDKVFVYHKKNEGALIARDYGIKKSSGDIVLFVDADDCLRNDALQLLYERFKEYSCDLILFNYSVSPDYHKGQLRFSFSDLQIFEGEEKLMLYELLITTRKLNNLCIKAVKKELMLNLRDYTEVAFVKSGDDLLMSIPIVSNAKRILYIKDILYFYRQREGSIVHKFDIRMAESVKAVHKELELYINLWGISEYHSKHYAREVKGWITVLIFLLKNKRSIEIDKFKSVLNDMSKDSYFRNAYEKMDKKSLKPIRYKILAYCLYKKRIGVIRIGAYLFEVIAKKKRKY